MTDDEEYKIDDNAYFREQFDKFYAKVDKDCNGVLSKEEMIEFVNLLIDL